MGYTYHSRTNPDRVEVSESGKWIATFTEGCYTVTLAGPYERIELTHRAATREHFARGAVRGAAWLVGKPPGLHRFGASP